MSLTLIPEWSYDTLPGHFDELTAPDGSSRSHWSAFVRSLETLSPEGFEKRWDEGRKLIADHGITYNVYEDPQSINRPWPLDPVPLLIGDAEWRSLEAAVVQRATLLNRILQDLYGPQNLVHAKRLPAEIVYRHPAFLRACHGIQPPDGVWLHNYAIDLARAPDGKWWVLSDRTQAPSGSGYALENRMVSARTLPDVLQQASARSLQPFFTSVKNSLINLAKNADNPRIVLLTPGPYNETYYEHAFLARHLGIALVEGGDLTVRDARVYLKTLNGLLPVDVILRRLDDSFCDPLELRADSMLGVPGLVEAVRQKNVAIANALGSGLVETAALPAFLPTLCQHLMGESLRIPSVATWWCGGETELSYVSRNLHGLVLKPSFGGRTATPIFTDRLSASELEAVTRRVLANPAEFVAQEQVALSTAPVFSANQKFEARPIVVRLFAVAYRGSYRVMPGGLTRVSSSTDTLVVSVQSGGGSKDTWVLGPEPDVVAARAATAILDVSRATIDLPSRVADNLLWLGRYTERVEFGYRTLRGILRSERNAVARQSGTAILENLGYLHEDETIEESLECLWDPERRGGLAWSVLEVRRLAWLLRDRISNDAWRVLHSLQALSAPREDALRVPHALDALDRGVLELNAFSGIVMESMTRGPAWRFLDLGRRIERALQLIDVLLYGLATFPASTTESGRLELLLDIADSTLTYRSRYLTTLQADLLTDLLLIDEANPRSVAFQIADIAAHLTALAPANARLDRLRPESRLILDCSTRIKLADVDPLLAPDEEMMRPEFENLLEHLGEALRAVCTHVTSAYLTHIAPQRASSVS
ncbi:hypothetical protein F183_A50750 [Bryobacterales bacterium F-183]|nr:hypothetical protein F183_A50750 [Bryobacterales bacterium F-183]